MKGGRMARSKEFLSSHEEIRYFQERPHLNTPGGYITPGHFANYEDELEYLPQDKSSTLEYWIAHEELSNPKKI